MTIRYLSISCFINKLHFKSLKKELTSRKVNIQNDFIFDDIVLIDTNTNN